MMKNNTDIPIPREEDNAAASKRRDDYALSRDLQAADYNNAIKRHTDEARDQEKYSESEKVSHIEKPSEEDNISPESGK